MQAADAMGCEGVGFVPWSDLFCFDPLSSICLTLPPPPLPFLPLLQRLEDDSLPYDAVIIGAGLAGVSLLAEAVKQGYKRVIVLERKPYIGGLWVDLPAWQTLQNDPADFCLNGFTTKRKVWTALDVCHMMEEYVRVAGMAPFIRLQTELADQVFDKDEADGQGDNGMWTLKVKQTVGKGGKEESSRRSAGKSKGKGKGKGNGGLASMLPGRGNSSSSSSSGVVERTLKTKMLILCTGKHSTAYLPEIPSDGSVPIVHSSQVHDWDALKGKNVAVVGGGASALDLVINALKVNEGQPADKAHTYWLLRTPKHFGGYVLFLGRESGFFWREEREGGREGRRERGRELLHFILSLKLACSFISFFPSSCMSSLSLSIKTKLTHPSLPPLPPSLPSRYDYADLILLTFFQLVFGRAANGFINYVMNLLVQATFWSFGLSHWLPSGPMDLTVTQYIPGRRYLLKNAARIDRCAGVEVVKVAHGNLHLSDGSVIEGVDALLMGTGYDRPQHNPNLGLRDAGPLLGSSIIQGEKLGHLFLFGEDLLDSTGSTPLTSHLTARHFWHQAGKTGGAKGFKSWHTASAAAKEKIIIPLGKNVNHFDILLMTAPVVPEVYPAVWWRFRMLGTFSFLLSACWLSSPPFLRSLCAEPFLYLHYPIISPHDYSPSLLPPSLPPFPQACTSTTGSCTAPGSSTGTECLATTSLSTSRTPSSATSPPTRSVRPPS